ncbi:MAG: protein-L-isoaspartate O-methyltransferase, partial [Mesorhizobium sp.]
MAASLVEESPTVMKPMNEEHLAVLRRHMVE